MNIGFNPSELRDKIHNTYMEFESICKEFINAGQEMSAGLQAVWCSPKAVEFATEGFPKYEETVKAIKSYMENVLQKMCNAGNEMAQSNGVNIVYFSDPLPETDQICVSLKEQADDGSVVMNSDRAIEIMKEFIYRIKNFMTSEVNRIDNSLPIFSTDDGAQQAYKMTMITLFSKIYDSIMEISEVFSTRLQENIAELHGAVQNATEELSGN